MIGEASEAWHLGQVQLVDRLWAELNTKHDRSAVNLHCRPYGLSATLRVMLDRPTRRRDLAMPPLMLGDWRKRRRPELLWLVAAVVGATCVRCALCSALA